MHINRRKFSGASKQFYSTSYFLGSKILKSFFLRKMGLECSFYQIEVWVVINMSNGHEKNKTLEMLLRADFLRIFENTAFFEIYENHQ